jgi:septal ring factor EnvC (AmiA/AmiB activator)
MHDIEPEIADDRSAILEDLKEEQVLEKELDDLEQQAEELEEQRARRRASLSAEAPPQATEG